MSPPSTYNLFVALVLTASLALVADALSFRSCDLARPFSCLARTQNLLSIQRQYDKINDYLEHEVPKSDDIEKNMAAIDAWINRITISKTREPTTEAQLEALNLFRDLSLNEAPTNKCSKSTYYTLLNNSRAMRNSLKGLQNGQTPKRRIERILLHFAKEHSELCDDHYLGNYLAGIKRIEISQLNKVRKFVGLLIEAQLDSLPEMLRRHNATNGRQYMRENPILTSKFIESVKTIENKLDYNKAMKLFSELKPEQTDDMLLSMPGARGRKSTQNKQWDSLYVTTLIHKNIGRPCRLFQQALAPAFKDNLIIYNKHLHKKDAFIKKQFYRDQALFRGCEKFDERPMKVTDRIVKLVTSKQRE